MTLKISGQIIHGKLIGKAESDAQHQIRCYMKILSIKFSY
jgi:hypothetical protein